MENLYIKNVWNAKKSSLFKFFTTTSSKKVVHPNHGFLAFLNQLNYTFFVWIFYNTVGYAENIPIPSTILTFWLHFCAMTFSPCLEPYLIPCGETTVMVGIWGDQGPKNVKDMLNLSSADKPAISGIENSPEISRLTFWSESWMGIKITSWLFLFSKPLLTCLSTEPT